MDKRELVGLLSNNAVIVSQQKRQYLVDFGQCRTAAKGGQILYCDHCCASAVVYNPCNRRGCPVCGPKNQLKWLKSAKMRTLPTGHIHLVFSFSDEITRRWQRNSRETVSFLFKSVNRALIRLERHLGVTLGRVLVFQSHGKALSYKAHVHCIITDGGLDDKGQWRKLGVIPMQAMKVWMKPLVKPEEIRIHQTRHETTGDRFLEYLGFRQFGLIVKANQINQVESTITVNEPRGVTQLAVNTFVQRYMDHIPEKGCVMVRYYGLYSTRRREEYAKAYVQLVVKEANDEPMAPYQICCPRCEQIMGLKATWIAGESMNYSRWGFKTHPPEHWEMAGGQ